MHTDYGKIWSLPLQDRHFHEDFSNYFAGDCFHVCLRTIKHKWANCFEVQTEHQQMNQPHDLKYHSVTLCSRKKPSSNKSGWRTGNLRRYNQTNKPCSDYLTLQPRSSCHRYAVQKSLWLWTWAEPLWQQTDEAGSVFHANCAAAVFVGLCKHVQLRQQYSS